MNRHFQHPAARFAASFVARYFSDRLSHAAAELAYFLLFSLFPLLLTGSALLGKLHIDTAQVLLMLQPVIPGEVLELIGEYLHYLGSIDSSALLLTGIGLTFYSVTRFINTLLYTLNRVYRVRQRRAGYLQVLLSGTLAVIMAVSLVVILVLIIFGEKLLVQLFGLLHQQSVFLHIWDMLRFILLAAWTLVLLTLLYMAAPNRRIRLTQALPGAVFAMAAWVVVSLAFSFYVNNMARYSLYYGSLGAIIVLMLWLYLTSVILLLGGLLNQTLEAFKTEKNHEKKRPVQADAVFVRREKPSDGK